MKSQDTEFFSAPIFILSCERSGSSLLRYIVDTHPDIASPAELELGELCKCLYHVVATTAGEVTRITAPTEKKPMILAEVRQMVSGLMEKYVDAKNKRMWCEKSPKNLETLNLIEQVFPDAKYICLYRNAMDVVHSLLESSRFNLGYGEQFRYVAQQSGNILNAMLKYWIDKTRILLEFERKNSKQCFRIKYESYVMNPVQALEPMFKFLGLEWDSCLLESVFSVAHEQGLEDLKVNFSTRIHQNSIGKGSTINYRYLAENLRQEMNGILEELDYPVVGADWNTAPSPYRIIIDSIPEQSKVVSNVGEIFTNYFPQRINELIDALQARLVIYKIVVTGNDGGIWMIDLTKSSNQIVAQDGKSDCTLTISSKDLLDITNGKLNPAEPWLQGRLHIDGDINLADIFGRVWVGRTPTR